MSKKCVKVNLNSIKRNNKISKHIVKTSKFLSLILRHKPEAISLDLDEYGWANIDELIALSKGNGHSINQSLIQRVVETNDKQRFSISEDGQFIRANQGHSISVDLELEPIQPPDTLFHGTATRFLESIFEQGLVKKNRQHVHLSAARETAINVGKRHGKPSILLIDAQAMHKNHYKFYLSKNRVWLTDHVPIDFIKEETTKRT